MDFTMTYACSMDVYSYIRRVTVCVNIKKDGMAVCVMSKRLVKMPSGNFFAKNDMPYQQLTVGVFWLFFFLNCVFVTKLYELHSLEKQ